MTTSAEFALACQKFFDREQMSSSLSVMSAFIHQTNIEAGWWSDPKTGERIERDPLELMALVHSELSEALEGDRKSLPDDKLPHREMREVELVDFLIRLCDITRGLGLSEDVLEFFNCNQPLGDPEKLFSKTQRFSSQIALLHMYISYAVEELVFAGLKWNSANVAVPLAEAIAACLLMADIWGFDLAAAMVEKCAYNKERADHKLAARLAEGGKAY